MMKIKFLILIIFVITTSLSQTVDDVINKHIEAIGGAEKLSGLKSISVNGTLDMGKINGVVNVIIVKPDKLKYEFGLMGVKILIVYNGREGWIFNPIDNNELEPVGKEDIDELQKQIDMIGPLFNYSEKGLKAELLQDEMVNGREAFVIKLTGKDSSSIFIDKETYMTVKKSSWEKDQGNLFEINTYYSEYKNFDGITFATNIKTESEYKKKNRTVTIERIELNKSYPDDLFEKPQKK